MAPKWMPKSLLGESGDVLGGSLGRPGDGLGSLWGPFWKISGDVDGDGLHFGHQNGAKIALRRLKVDLKATK